MATKNGKATVVRTPKGVKDPVKPTLADVQQRIEDTLDKFGAPDAASKAGIDASATLKRSEEAVRAWHAVASLSEQSGQSGRAFGVAVDGNANTRQRLLAADSILRAGRKARKSVPFWEAVADGNKSATHSANIVARLTRGEDVYGAPKAERVAKRAAKPGTTPKVTKVNPVDALGIILANVSRMTDTKVLSEVARLAGEVQSAAEARVAAMPQRAKVDGVKARKAS